MTPRTVNVSMTSFPTRILASRSALICLLGLSFSVGLSVAGSSPGVIGALFDFLALSFLILCPVCARGFGNRAIMTLGAVTGVVAIVDLLFKLMIVGSSSAWFTDVAWGAIQLALVGLANNTGRLSNDSSGAQWVAATL